MIRVMTATSLLQLKQRIAMLSENERTEIAAHMHRLKQQSPAWKKEMTRRSREMDQGKKVPLSTRIPRPRDAVA